jgi:anti-sigma B factor antagonist
MNHPALALGPELTIAFAAAERQRLAEALQQQPQGLVLDLSGVTEFDSAGVQLLLATRRSLAARGQTLALLDASPVVRDALAVFGLQHTLPVGTH